MALRGRKLHIEIRKIPTTGIHVWLVWPTNWCLIKSTMYVSGEYTVLDPTEMIHSIIQTKPRGNM